MVNDENIPSDNRELDHKRMHAKKYTRGVVETARLLLLGLCSYNLLPFIL